MAEIKKISILPNEHVIIAILPTNYLFRLHQKYYLVNIAVSLYLKIHVSVFDYHQLSFLYTIFNFNIFE